MDRRLFDKLPQPNENPDVEITDHRRGYDGFFKLDVYKLRHRRHDGGWTGEMTREVFERGHAAAMLPYDPVRDQVVLIEQFRLPAHLGGLNSWQLEVVAGIIEHGETPEAVVRRETPEETGLTVDLVVPILRYMPSQGGTTENLYLFCGRVDSSMVEGIHGIDEEHEDIQPRVMAVDDALALLDEGKIQNSPAIICLQWLAANRVRLRREWQNGS